MCIRDSFWAVEEPGDSEVSPLSTDTERPDLDQLFRTELESRGISYRVNQTGEYEFKTAGAEFEVNLETLRRQFANERDPSIVSSFVDRLSVYL